MPVLAHVSTAGDVCRSTAQKAGKTSTVVAIFTSHPFISRAAIELHLFLGTAAITCCYT
jgi:hypothetical protein